jgi:hydrogenase nickel incorporation protein HypA/HybF
VHELAVAQALVEQVDAVIDQHNASAASLIRVRIGPLAGVVPELLASAFPLAAAGSRMERAVLDLVAAPVKVRCQTCGLDTEAAMNRLICGACGDWHTQVISGDELLLESVELETAPTLNPDPWPLDNV